MFSFITHSILGIFQVADILPRVISAVRTSQAEQESQIAQLDLISVCQETLQPGGRLVNASRAAVPTVKDPASSVQLSNATKTLAESLAELRTSLTKVCRLIWCFVLVRLREVHFRRKTHAADWKSTTPWKWSTVWTKNSSNIENLTSSNVCIQFPEKR